MATVRGRKLDRSAHPPSMARCHAPPRSVQSRMEIGETLTLVPLIRCRARVSHYCEHGRPVSDVYEAPDWEKEDGTYNRLSETVVCNQCYVKLMPLTPSGQALNHELELAILAARRP